MTEVIYEGGPTGRAPTRYEVETLEPSLWSNSDALEWTFRDSFATSGQAIRRAKDLQKRGARVRVVPVRPKTADKAANERHIEREARRRVEKRQGVAMVALFVAVVAACTLPPVGTWLGWW